MKLADFILKHDEIIAKGQQLSWITLTYGTTPTASIDDINEISK